MDILIDPYRYVPATPACTELATYVMQAQGFGGAIVGDGLPQSGVAITARADFIASLQSYVWENFDAKAVAGAPYNTYHDWPSYPSSQKLSVLGGAGQMYGSEGTGFNQYVLDLVIGPSANGRFNTTANAAGRWVETDGTAVVDLTSTYTAFGCFVTDMGDYGGELEIELWNGATLARRITVPTDHNNKPTAGEGGWIDYKNGNTPFNKIKLVMRQFSFDPGEYDYVGIDDLIVGQVVTCVASTGPSTHYGRNTTATTAKTVAGPAKTACDAWIAAAVTSYVQDFEGVSVGTGSSWAALTFPGISPSVTGDFATYAHSNGGAYPYNNIRAADATAAIANAGGSDRWNTTSAGSKWLEFKDELIITFSRGDVVTRFGFYFTDLGNQNATLRVTFRRTNGAAVVYYVPKAAELSSPVGLLGFWGVINELPILQVVIQVVYYDDLTADTYSRIPAWASGAAIETVGIDDILIG